MRNNIDDARSTGLRQFSSKWSSVEFQLTGSFVIPDIGPIVYSLDAGSAARSVYLPEIEAERYVVVGNTGTTHNLNILDSLGAALTTIPPDGMGIFFATHTRWVWFSTFDLVDPGGVVADFDQVITAAGAVVATAGDYGIAINKSLASATPIALPAVALRDGRPLRIAEIAGTTDIANPITLTPNGAEKINGLPTLEISTGNSATMLFPSIAINGWYTI